MLKTPNCTKEDDRSKRFQITDENTNLLMNKSLQQTKNHNYKFQ